MEFLIFSILVIILGIVACLQINRAYDDGAAKGTRHLQNQAVTRGYGEFYIDENDERQFRWTERKENEGV